MYLTRFRVNTARPGARRLLSAPQALHAAVLASFPGLLPGHGDGPEGPRVLWRLDHNARAEVFLYIVGPDRPDLTHLVEQAGWPVAAADPATPGWETRPYGPFLDRLETGGVWSFRLTANPVHYIRRKEGEPTKRTAHITPHHQLGWLLDDERQKRSGYQVLEKPAEKRLLPGGTTLQGRPHHGDAYEAAVRDQRELSFGKSAGGRGSPVHRVKIVTVTYDGRLTVTDPVALRRTLTRGIGKARAYGCGLMTLVPAASEVRP
ncbi:type I-E CRISPR-associated protein Cas6/Cse3/CasE [Streptomyces tsukubensis]